MVYITFNNELVYDGKVLKNQDNDIIYVNDIFATFESSKKIDSVSKQKFKKYKYSFNLYVIDDKKELYEIINTNNNISVVKLTSDSNKVKEYIYEKDISKLTIVFEDNTTKVVYSNNNNKELLTSTIYDRNSNNNEKVLIQP